jgi:hypothetical protein
MSPAIEAAWIAAGVSILSLAGTVVVALAGFRNTRAATTVSLRADRDNRIWDRKTEAYQLALSGALYRSNHRQQLLAQLFAEGGREEYSVEAAKAFTDMTEREWNDLLGRLGTLGSEEVIDAYMATLEATREAHRRLSTTLENWLWH